MATPEVRNGGTSARRNFNRIHAHPLPLRVHPLPPLIPHNPVSLVHVTFVYLSQLFFPPSSYPDVEVSGYFCPSTLSVHVTDSSAALVLWENGFFGKGSLSRSEPSWLEREYRKRGVLAKETSEEVTRKRRAERQEFKRERAWKEKTAIEETLRKERANGKIEPPTDVKDAVRDEESQVPTRSKTQETFSPEADAETPVSAIESQPGTGQTPDFDLATIPNQEHLQLNMEEALFLSSALGVLKVYFTATGRVTRSSELLSLFIAHSTFPAKPISSSEQLMPDNRFLVSYVAYHHFRSLGWVVRPGIKFAVDLLLYNRGPVFAHAEFAVIVLPDFSHEYWKDTERASGKPWHWLHMVNRVQSQVRKTLILCYVEIPPPRQAETPDNVALGSLLRRYRVREIVLKRWIPNRSRD